MKKVLLTLVLALGLEAGYGQTLNVSGSLLPGRLEFGLLVSDTVSPTSVLYTTSGLGWFLEPYVYMGAGLNVQVKPSFYMSTELYPVLSMKHRDRIDRGNNMVGDEFMFGARVRIGPAYVVQLLSQLDLLLKTGLELECPILATSNALAEFQVRGYVGLELILRNL